MYQKIHQLAEEFLNYFIDESRILMIGDSLATDIKGANYYGVDSLMVLTGVHGEVLLPLWTEKEKFNEKLSFLLSIYQSKSTYVIPYLDKLFLILPPDGFIFHSSGSF